MANIAQETPDPSQIARRLAGTALTPPGPSSAGAIDGAPYVNPNAAVHPAVQAAGAAASNDPSKSIQLTAAGSAANRPTIEGAPNNGGPSTGVGMQFLSDMWNGKYNGAGMTPVAGAPTAAPAAPTPTTPAAAPAAPVLMPMNGQFDSESQTPAAATPTPAAPVLPTAAPVAGAPAPAPSAGTITMGGKTVSIPQGASPQPTGPLDAYGNSTAATTQMQGELSRIRAEKAQSDQQNQATQAGYEKDADARDAKQKAWSDEVSASSIVNRPQTPMIGGGSPAQIQAQVALAGINQQAQNARLSHAGVMAGHAIQQRGQDINAGTATRGQDISAGTAARGQDLSAGSAHEGHLVQAQNAALSSDTQLATNANTNNTALLTNANTVEGSKRNTDVTSAAHVVAAKATAEAAAKHYSMVAQGWHPGTMPGTYYRTGLDGGIQEWNPTMAAIKGAPKAKAP